MAKKAAKETKKIGEVQLPEVEVLKNNDAKGMPEAGASMGMNSCSKVQV